MLGKNVRGLCSRQSAVTGQVKPFGGKKSNRNVTCEKQEKINPNQFSSKKEEKELMLAITF
jgi:hypothetical protein